MLSTITLSQEGVKQAIEIALQADTPLFIMGSFGIGKSTIVKQVAKELNLELIDIRLSQVQQFDLMGYPKDVNGRMEYLPLADIPIESDPLPNGKNGWLILLDELNSADKYVQGAAFKLVLDRQIGKHHLHPNVRIICAGNRIQDQGLVNKLLAPMKTRLTHIEMYVDNKEFLKYVYEQTDQGLWHPYIYAFLNFKPDQINNADPSVESHTYATPRTWELLSKQLNAGLDLLDPSIYTPIVCGIVGDSAGMDFVSFLESFSQFPSIQQVEADPMNASLPSDLGAKWALGIWLSQHMTQTNKQQIVDYATRISEPDLRVVIYRYLVMKDPSLMANPKIQATLVQTQKQLAGI